MFWAPPRLASTKGALRMAKVRGSSTNRGKAHDSKDDYQGDDSAHFDQCPTALTAQVRRFGALDGTLGCDVVLLHLNSDCSNEFSPRAFVVASCYIASIIKALRMSMITL